MGYLKIIIYIQTISVLEVLEKIYIYINILFSFFIFFFKKKSLYLINKIENEDFDDIKLPAVKNKWDDEDVESEEEIKVNF